MIGNFRRVSTRLVQELRANPDRITNVLYPDSKTDTVIDEDVKLDLGKAWHGVHFLLTGQPWGSSPPLDFIVAGEEIGDVDVGYGPARGFTNDEVKAIAVALAPITADVLRSRFDPQALVTAQIYPYGQQAPGDDEAQHLAHAFEDLKEFVEVTAEAGAGMIVYVN